MVVVVLVLVLLLVLLVLRRWVIAVAPERAERARTRSLVAAPKAPLRLRGTTGPGRPAQHVLGSLGHRANFARLLPPAVVDVALALPALPVCSRPHVVPPARPPSQALALTLSRPTGHQQQQAPPLSLSHHQPYEQRRSSPLLRT
ncbi:hypothetical protein K491DRAFT_695223 [Lophiostoma macrostomum CBS 122681]|uniref:Secreted protein n=1 Tax=Lophiostoma macrostomum CBS 122681 TaxID=1314788 RepID=A0A6A6SZ97_9PLEO|nr:hypothetical protein K491DRAFT_695223 [Lophiostoma macrostomum CBS 122681]